MANPAHDATLVDNTTIHDATIAFAERLDRKVSISYVALHERLQDFRREKGWRPAVTLPIYLAVDPKSEGQRKLSAAIDHAGFEPEAVHFRDAYVSLPPGKSPGDVPGRSLASFSSRVAYLAGLMGQHLDAHFLIVSHAFELLAPLTDLVGRMTDAESDGKVGLAFFSSLLDFRWRAAGLFDGALDIEFFDLDPFAEALLGVELTERQSSQTRLRSVFSRFVF